MSRRGLGVLVFACLGLGSCTTDLGVTVDVKATPEGRWETLDPVALVTTAPGGEDAVVGTVLSEGVSLHVADNRGEPFVGLPVTWTVNHPSAGAAEAADGHFATTFETVLDGQGESSVFWKTGTMAGDQSITATVAPPRGGARPVTTTFDVAVTSGKPSRLRITPNYAAIEMGVLYQFTAVVTDEYGNDIDDVDVEWSSTDHSVATVAANGTVTTRGVGVGAIFAKVPGYEYGAKVEVVSESSSGAAALGSLEISPEAVYRARGETKQLSVNAENSSGNPISPLVSWETTDPSVATVSGTGLITAIANGRAFIRATNACCEVDSIPIKVRDDPNNPSSVGDLDWFCDWRYSVGIDGSALWGRNAQGPSVATTGQCFDAWSADPELPNDNLGVEAKGSLNFPSGMQNVYRVTVDRNKSDAGMVQVGFKNGGAKWDTMAVGEYMYLRSYDQLNFPQGVSTNTHVLHMGTNETNYGFRYFFDSGNGPGADGSYNMQIAVWGGGLSGRGVGGFYPQSGDLRSYQVIRRELRWHRFHPDSARINIRVSNEANQLIATGADYVCDIGACQQMGGGAWAARDTLGEHAFYVPPGTWDRFTGMELGNNGSEGGDPNGPQNWYWSGLAVRVTSDADAWIGRYPVGPEGN